MPDFGNLDWGVFSATFAQEPNLGRWILNSFVVALAVTFGQLITSALAAYALAMLIFPGKTFFFFVFLATLMIPWEATIVPNYLTVVNLGLEGQLPGPDRAVPGERLRHFPAAPVLPDHPARAV